MALVFNVSFDATAAAAAVASIQSHGYIVSLIIFCRSTK